MLDLTLKSLPEGGKKSYWRGYKTEMTDNLPLITEENLEGASGFQDPELAGQFELLKTSRDSRIRQNLIEKHLGIVIPIARKFKGFGESLEDLIQVGYIGLIKAVDNFDESRGVRFITYATHCINGEIRHYLRDKTESIKLPRWLRSLSSQVSSFMENFLQNNERLPSIGEISQSLNISEDGIIEILKAKKPISLSNLEGNDAGSIESHRIKSIRYETFRLPIEDRIAIEEAVEDLKNVEKKIIYLFFYQDLNQTQIAKNLGLSQKKVSRMLQKSLGKLRDMLFPRGR